MLPYYSKLFFFFLWPMVFLAIGCCAYALSGSYDNYTTIYLDSTGHGDYQTIQSAIDSVPNNNSNWICIYVKAGTYREQVIIPKGKPFIYLKGEGKRKTNIIWEDGSGNITRATFTNQADNIIVKSMTFINSYNFPPENNTRPVKAAVAAMVMGENVGFYRCGFKGLQDTIWDVEGHHYFKRCTIHGAVDFIFGNAHSIYEECSIVVNSGTRIDNGYITAQGRDHAEESTAFVFKDCRVFGSGKTYLGRPWRAYARVIFYNTFMDNIVLPQGWDYDDNGYGPFVSFAEFGCSGPGSNKSRQSQCLGTMSGEELQSFTNLSFINIEGWLYMQPLKKLLL